MYNYHETQFRLNFHLSVLIDDAAAFRVHYWGANPRHFDNPLHKHSFFEVCYVLDGKGSYLDDGNVYGLDKGSLFCSRPGAIHQIQSPEGLKLLFVAFEVDESKTTPVVVDRFRYLISSGNICVHAADESPTACLWRSLLIRENVKWEIDPVCLSSMARSLLLSFTGLFADHQKDTEKKITNHSHMLLQQAKLFIRDNLDQKLTLGMVASYLNMSERQLSRLFSEHVNESFKSFVRKERIEKAAYLLKTTDWPIKEIADRLGFGSVHYFTRAFTSLKNVSPGNYQKHILSRSNP